MQSDPTIFSLVESIEDFKGLSRGSFLFFFYFFFYSNNIKAQKF